MAYLQEDQVNGQLAAGKLVHAIADLCPSFSGYHLYYPSRRQNSPASSLLVEALHYRS